jgi:hypothetical protein
MRRYDGTVPAAVATTFAPQAVTPSPAVMTVSVTRLTRVVKHDTARQRSTRPT